MTDSPSYNPAIHHRRSVRLRGYDYSQAGAYVITICTNNRECIFGTVGAGSKPALCCPNQQVQMQLNNYGKIVKDTWEDLINHNDGIELDAFVVMPNHIHGIIVLVGTGSIEDRAGLEPAPTGTQGLSEIVRQLKTFSARRINSKRGTKGVSVWQRNYYEHVIRDEADLTRIREYIANNPVNWQSDENYPVTF